MSAPDHHHDLRCAVEGNRPALERLWRRQRRWVAALLLAHKPRESELEDLLQEVAVTLVGRIHEIRDPRKLLSWLRTVALNVARTAGRRARSRRKHLRLVEGNDLHVVDPATERARHAEEARDDVTKALGIVNRLHPDYREPLLLRAVHGLSQRRIAEILALPVTTVETRLARARRMLREELLGEPSDTALGSESPALRGGSTRPRRAGGMEA
ncbi:MAG: RNA polymerase sigma factor [Planctomycetota bacterium]